MSTHLIRYAEANDRARRNTATWHYTRTRPAHPARHDGGVLARLRAATR